MIDLGALVLRLTLPLVLAVFLGLYVLGLTAGASPELALGRAGLAGLVLALIGRAAIWIVEQTPRPRGGPIGPAGQALDAEPGDDVNGSVAAADGTPSLAPGPSGARRKE